LWNNKGGIKDGVWESNSVQTNGLTRSLRSRSAPGACDSKNRSKLLFWEPFAALILQPRQACCKDLNIQAKSDFFDREVGRKHSSSHFRLSINSQTIQSRFCQHEYPTTDIRRLVLAIE
jgi:hypothetical protein